VVDDLVDLERLLLEGMEEAQVVEFGGGRRSDVEGFGLSSEVGGGTGIEEREVLLLVG